MNTFGLGAVWETIQSAGSALVAQFQSLLTQLLFAGTQAWNNAKPIFAQLIADLTNHTGDAVSIVSQAIAQLNQVLANAGKRDVVDFLLNQLGLQAVWETIQSAGTSLVGQLTALLTQLLFAGTQALNNAKPIIAQLVADLTAHAGDAVPLVQQAIQQLLSVLQGAGNFKTIFFTPP